MVQIAEAFEVRFHAPVWINVTVFNAIDAGTKRMRRVVPLMNLPPLHRLEYGLFVVKHHQMPIMRVAEIAMIRHTRDQPFDALLIWYRDGEILSCLRPPRSEKSQQR